MKIPFFVQEFTNEMEESAINALRNESFVGGESVSKFEEEFAEYTGTKYAVSVSSGNAALQISLMSLGISDNSKVITPTNSFIASANCIRMVNAKPILVDIDLRDGEIDININPIQANLNWIVDMNKGNFIGKDAINREQMKNNKSKLIAFKMLERGIPRTGYDIYIDDKLVGKVTSGTHSPSLNVGIGLGYIKENYIKDKQKIQIEIREKRYDGIIFNKPFINNNSLFN